MSDTITIPVSDQYVLSGNYQRPTEQGLAERDNKLILFIHDFPGNKAGHNDLYTDLSTMIGDLGFHSLSFDFLGCGESSGDQSNFTLAGSVKESLDAIHKWAKGNGYNEFVYVSAGLGTSIAILNAGTDVTCQIMLWPGLDPAYLAKNLFNSEYIGEEWKKVGYIIQGEDCIGIPFIKELERIDLAPSLENMTMPVLIMHGSADDRYPVDHLSIAREGMPSKRIEITTFHNAEHGIPDLTHRKSMFYHITQFLEKYA